MKMATLKYEQSKYELKAVQTINKPLMYAIYEKKTAKLILLVQDKADIEIKDGFIEVTRLTIKREG